MIAIGLLFLRVLCDWFKPRRRLEAEILVLRHQFNVLQRGAPRWQLRLRWVDRALYPVFDNCATHKRPTVLARLAHYPRWTFHFTLTSDSWLNAVENFFSKMTHQRIRRGLFRPIADLQAAVNPYLAEQNTSSKPFVWTQSADAILANLSRFL